MPGMERDSKAVVQGTACDGLRYTLVVVCTKHLNYLIDYEMSGVSLSGVN